MPLRRLQLQSEEFSPTGGIGGEGAIRSLGRPRFDPLTLLIRETLQNSVDAGLDNGRSVHYQLDLWKPTAAQFQVLKDVVFHAMPPCATLDRHLGRRHDLVVLAISDRNTTGLGGPTRADDVRAENGVRNFVEFFRNIGRSHDRAAGAGSYGYGKAALFVNSRAKAIVGYTRCSNYGTLQCRLMAAALGDQGLVTLKGRQRRVTGRHWWGARSEDGIVDPLVGAEAVRLAELLGLPPFTGGTTGTTILVVQPWLGEERTLEQAVTAMVLIAIGYGWPRMLPSGHAAPRLSLAATCEGRSVSVPDLETLPLLHGYREALELLRTSGEEDAASALDAVRTVRCLRPQRQVGRLALRRVVEADTRVQFDVGTSENDRAVLEQYGGPSHVALMRKPRLVVKYAHQTQVLSGSLGYRGVFVAEDNLDQIFADAEPPTHDEWHPESIEGRSRKTFVTVALRRIRELSAEFIGGEAPTAEGMAVALGGFSKQLASLLPDTEGSGAEGLDAQYSGGGAAWGGGRPAQSSRLEVTGEPTLEMVGDLPTARIEFNVECGRRGAHARVTAVPMVLILDGSTAEGETPEGASRPRVVHWRRPDGAVVSQWSDCVTVGPETEGRWSVNVDALHDTLIAVRLTVEEEDRR